MKLRTERHWLGIAFFPDTCNVGIQILPLVRHFCVNKYGRKMENPDQTNCAKTTCFNAVTYGCCKLYLVARGVSKRSNKK